MDKKNLPQILESYAIELDNQEKPQTTINAYLTDLCLMFDYLNINEINKEVLQSITLDNLRRFLNYSKNKENNSASTIARKVASIKSLYKFLKSNKLISENIALELKTPKLGKRMIICPSLEESYAILDNIIGEYGIRDTAIIGLFLNCGLRVSELVSASLERIKGDKLTVIGKGNKEREIDLNDICLEYISDYLKVRPNVKPDKLGTPLFISKRLQRIAVSTVEDLVKKHVKSANLSNNYSPHKLRHGAATLMYKYGNVDIATLQEILGHEDINTTKIYTHVDDEQRRNAVKSNPLNMRAKVNQIKVEEDIDEAVGE